MGWDLLTPTRPLYPHWYMRHNTHTRTHCGNLVCTDYESTYSRVLTFFCDLFNDSPIEINSKGGGGGDI